jgi:hypothetical protein
MRRWFYHLDRVLRGEATHPAALQTQKLDIPVFGLTVVLLLLALSYGACSGMYAGCRTDDPSYMQWLSTTLKVPALFLLTLVVTFPSLYVFNALIGSRLSVRLVLQLAIAAMAVNLAVLAGMGPIVGLFSVSTSSWSFMILLNVAVYAASGVLGMVFLFQTLQRLSVTPQWPSAKLTPPPDDASGEGDARDEAPAAGPGRDVIWDAQEPGALDRLEGHVLGRHVKSVFYCWMLIFGLVGAQMAWVLRPFFGRPHAEFIWFSERKSNFFQGVWDALQHLMT